MSSVRPADRIIAGFDELNTRYFKGSLWHPVFAFPLPDPNKQSWYGRNNGVAFIALTTACLARNWQFIADALLHEMVHHALSIRDENTSTEVHGPAFIELANRIGGAMGLSPVAPDSEDAAQWPHSVRPRGFYRATA